MTGVRVTLDSPWTGSDVSVPPPRTYPNCDDWSVSADGMLTVLSQATTERPLREVAMYGPGHWRLVERVEDGEAEVTPALLDVARRLADDLAQMHAEGAIHLNTWPGAQALLDAVQAVPRG